MEEARFAPPKPNVSVFQGGSGQCLTLNNGRSMPAAGLGAWALRGRRAHGLRLQASSRRYGVFYENEREVGRALCEAVRSGIRREDIFVQTKLNPSQYGDPERALKEGVMRLGLDYVDTAILHHPGANDLAACRAKERAVERGLARPIGLSNGYVDELTTFLPGFRTRPALVQNEIHPFHRERDVVPVVRKEGIAVQSRYPLGGRGRTKAIFAHPTIAGIAKRLGRTPAQVVLRWQLERGVAVIPGSSDPGRIRENAELCDFSLAADDLRAIAVMDRGEKHDWY